MAPVNVEDAAFDRTPAHDPWRCAGGVSLQQLVAHVEAKVLEHEAVAQPRLRRRRAVDSRQFTATLEALVSDVVHNLLLGRESIHLSRDAAKIGKRSRYRAKSESKQRITVLKLLTDVGYIRQTEGKYLLWGATQTEIGAAPPLRDLVRAFSVTSEDIGRAPGEELLQLRTDKAGDRPQLAEYTDDQLTNRLRTETREINSWVAGADIAYVGGPINGKIVDTSDRRQRRVFTHDSWSHGGRLYGGFWQPLPKALRLQHVRIGGEAVVSLDFAATFPALAYASTGKVLPEGDAYALPELPRLPRKTVKQLTSSLFASSRPLTRWPKGIESHGVPFEAAFGAIARKHREIAHLFGTGACHGFMFTESCILVDALLQLKAAGVVGLGIHDCVVVPASAREVAAAAMREASRCHAGAPLTFTIEEVS